MNSLRFSLPSSLRAAVLATVIAVSLGATALLGPTAAQADPGRDRVELLLNAYDTPATADAFREASPDPRAALIAIAQDPSVPRHRRFAALQALALFPDAQVRAIYRAILQGATDDGAPRIVHPTIQAMMKAFGADALVDIEPLLLSKDVQVRLTAVHAIATFGGDKGGSVLRAHAEREPNRIVLEELQRMVAQLR